MICREDVGVVILLCTTQNLEDMARAFGATREVSRVERVRRPYDFVIHAAGPAQVEVIEARWSSKSGSVLAVPSLTRRYRAT